MTRRTAAERNKSVEGKRPARRLSVQLVGGPEPMTDQLASILLEIARMDTPPSREQG